MKQIIISALLLLAVLAGCSKDQPSPFIVGSWKTLDSDPTSRYYTFYPDGSMCAQIEFGGNNCDYEWSRVSDSVLQIDLNDTLREKWITREIGYRVLEISIQYPGPKIPNQFEKFYLERQ